MPVAVVLLAAASTLHPMRLCARQSIISLSNACRCACKTCLSACSMNVLIFIASLSHAPHRMMKGSATIAWAPFYIYTLYIVEVEKRHKNDGDIAITEIRFVFSVSFGNTASDFWVESDAISQHLAIYIQHTCVIKVTWRGERAHLCVVCHTDLRYSLIYATCYKSHFCFCCVTSCMGMGDDMN